MNEDRGIGAMPKLYGAPAYARPPAEPVTPVERPFDPDAMPLEAELTTEERELVTRLLPRPYDPAPQAAPDHDSARGFSILRGRPFRLRIPGR